jgi:hypothetical protein
LSQKISRLHALTGLGSLIMVAGCAGSPGVRALVPTAASGTKPGARFDATQYYRVVKSKVAPLNIPRRHMTAVDRSASGTSYDSASNTSVVSDGNGNSVWYASDGTALMAINTVQLADGNGVGLTMTAPDGTQRSSTIAPASAFDGTTTTVGALTLSSNASSGQYIGNYQTDGGVVTIATSQGTLGDYTTTLPDGTTFTVSQATLISSGLIPSSHARSPKDLSNPLCIAAIVAAVAAVLGLIAVFWYASPIIVSIATSISTAAGTTGGVQLIGGTAVWGALATALIAAAGTAIAIVNNLCAPAGPITLAPSAVTLQFGQSTAITIMQSNYYAQTFTASLLNGPAGAPSVSTSGSAGNIATVTAGNTAGTWQYAIGDRGGTSSYQAVLTVTVVGPSPSPSPTQTPTQTPTQSPSPSSTPSPTPTPSHSPSSTPSPTPTPSRPPSSSPSPSPSSTPSRPPSPSPSPTPSRPPSPPPSPSYSPTVLPSPQSPMPSYTP